MFVIYSLANGGAQRVIATMANYFIEKNHEITIVTMTNDQPFFPIHPDVRIKKLGIDKSSLSKHNFLSANIVRLKAIYKEMANIRPDIVISFMTSANVLSIVASKLLKIPVIVSERTFHPRVSKIWGKLRRLVYPYSDALVLLSPEDFEYYSYHKNRTIIKNPIAFVPPKNIDFQKKEKVIIAAGRLHPVKGFDLLLKAFAKIENKENWKLMILGEGSERPFLEKMISDLKISSNVEMPGRVDNIESYLYNASIFVLSSRNEGFPNALVESMAFGCAPVSFDCKTGPNTIIRNNENGLLIEDGNIEKLSEAIEKLMNDTDFREKIAQKAMDITKELSVTNIMKQWEDLITAILKKES